MFKESAEGPRFTTVYGGEAIERNGNVVFIKEPNQEEPHSVGYVVGSRVPVDWDLIPLNEVAIKRIAHRDDQYPWPMC